MNMSSYKCCQSNTSENQSILSQSSLIKLIAEESRLKLLCILNQGTHCVYELTQHLNMSQSLISHHLADLKEAGIVVDKKDGRQVHYSLTAKGLRVISSLSSLSN